MSCKLVAIAAAACAALWGACGEDAPTRPRGGGGGGGGAGGNADAAAPPGTPGPAFLAANPAQLGFDCTAVGCRTTKVVALTNTGNGDLIVSKVDLVDGSSRDFNATPASVLPARVTPNAKLDVSVVYIPTDAITDRATVRVEFGNAAGGDPQTLQIEIEARSFGSAAMIATPTDLNFGYVPLGTRGAAVVTLRNTSTGTNIVSVSTATMTPAGPFRLENPIPPIVLLNPGQSRSLNVFYEPTENGVRSTTLKFEATSGEQAVPAVEVAVRATTYQNPTVAVSPASLAFPTILKGENRSLPIEIRNVGANGLQVTGLRLATGASTAFSLNPAQPPATALSTGQLFRVNVDFTPLAAGSHTADLVVSTNDQSRAEVHVPLSGNAVWPRLQISPATIDFGQLVRGWTSATRNVVLKNVGVGSLEIQQVAFGPGSSSNFSFVGTAPVLPRTLNENETLTAQVKYAAGTTGLETAAVRVVSTDAENRTAQANLAATGVTCEQGCPMSNAAPRCDRGYCEIASCSTGYTDTDGLSSTGCECAVELSEASSFCGDARWMGSISDDPSQSVTIIGKLTSNSDVDWYNVYAVDNGGINEAFGDDFGVRVRVTEKPSAYSIRVCVYHVKRGSHQAVCSYDNAQCGDDISWGGTWGSGDSADVFIRVDTATTGRTSCEQYKIVVSNG